MATASKRLGMVKTSPVSTFTSVVDERNGVVVMAMGGDAALEHVDELESAVTKMVARSPKKLVVDLSDVSFIASLGVGQLVTLCLHVKRKGGRAVVASPPSATREVLDRCKMHTVVPLASDVDEAIAMLSGT